MAVEFAARRSRQTIELPPIDLLGDNPIVLDWRVMLRAMVQARQDGAYPDDLAAAFHRALTEAIVEVARRIGIPRVLLTGGCFQNVLLAETALTALGIAGFESYTHHRIPPNDGGIAAGQIAYVARMAFEEIA
jgi:hydrogenase maturation protein HypF